MPEFYPADLTGKSFALYQAIKSWAETRRDVTLIGGWAVFELVQAPMSQRSRDVDVVFHTTEALDEFRAQAPQWGLQLDHDKLDRIAFFRLKDDTTRTIQIDLFTTFELGYRHFPFEATVYLKSGLPSSWSPGLHALLLDKVRTIPLRQGPDAQNKQAKDLLDVHRLVFHNRNGIPPHALLSVASKGERNLAAGDRIAHSKKSHPGFADEFDQVGEWLFAPDPMHNELRIR